MTTAFLTNLGRTLRFYADTQASKMSAEEMVLHTLYQNGTRDVNQLEQYARDDVERHGVKIAELAKKMQAAYTDTVSYVTTPQLCQQQSLTNSNLFPGSDGVDRH